MPTAASRDRAREQVRRWSNELIDLSKRNTSLYYRPLPRSTVEIVSPESDEVLQLLQGGPVRFFAPPSPGEEGAEAPQPDEDELVTGRATAADLHKSLAALARQSELDFTDKGLRSLYLCFGLLKWREADNSDPVRSPLVFLPVSLTRSSPRDPYRLALAEDDPTANVSLQVALGEQFDLPLPEPDFDAVFAGEGLAGYFEQVRAVVASRGWSVDPHVVLKRATFHKEAMFRDLRDHLTAISQHELVVALADPERIDEDALAGAEPPSEDRIDEAQPPERARLILDADASQRRAVQAAVQGTSFVMDGPPGSGKSQTIANVLAELMAAGKSVLFVSEKIAALEVVASRLGERGLGHFLFELHSHKLSRKEVAQELGRTLQYAPVAHPKLAGTTLREAEDVRLRLSRHAEAMNKVREPLGRSAAWVTGRLAQLHDLPDLPPADVGADLDEHRAAALLQAFDALARAWAPAEEGPSFAWRGLELETYADGVRRELERTLEGLATSLAGAQIAGEEVAARTGLALPASRSDVERIAAVLRHLGEHPQPDIPAAWWSNDDLEAIDRRIEELQDRADRLHTARHHLGGAYRDERWRELPVGGIPQLDRSLQQLRVMVPPLLVPERFEIAELERRVSFCDRTSELAGTVAAESDAIAGALGAGARQWSMRDAKRLASLARRADETTRPEESWAAPVVMAQVQQALDVLTPLVDEHQRRHEELAEVFDDDVYELDLQGLLTRFEQTHHGLRKLGSAYRADKRAVAAVAKVRKATPQVREQLKEARDLQRLHRRLDEAEQTHQATLGRYFRPRSSDTDAAQQALETLRLAADVLGRDYDHGAVSAQLAGTYPQDPTLGRRGRELEGELEAWTAQAEALHLGSLADLPLDSLGSWARDAGTALTELVDLLRKAVSSRTKQPLLSEVREDLSQRTDEHNLTRDISDRAASDAELLGGAYAGPDTDFSQLRRDLQWARELQDRHGGALPDSAVARLHAAQDIPTADGLSRHLESIPKHEERLLEHFNRDRGEELREELTLSLDEAIQAIGRLQDQIERIEEWVAFTRQRQWLSAEGWHAPVEGAIAAALPRQQLAPALEKCLYASWFDSISETDPALQRARADDLDAWVTQFRDLDHQLITDAAERVVEACVARRPKTAIGMARIIEGEANKKRRHMPVRTLLDKAADVTRALKPCFMMSPLAVSQYLPSGFTFDAVVFDEASQITPADAVNCIYRGAQLIVAGDDKQLPPTSFFQVGALDDGDDYEEGQFDEFESILAQCKRTPGFYSLPLRWHYRSRHESLITFSNYIFYDGKLITFPGAREDARALGVEAIRVDGVYRRGGPRDNPLEAQEVAERVLHYATEHPDRTLGVVAFSEAQAEAIASAVEHARVDRPELDDFFTSDRLDGFFVKNLENVQGDERDVMLFSIGYGPDEAGKFTMNFGPLNRHGGWRRLNVAITRAKRRVEVISSFGAAQMDTRGSTNEGVKALQRYLDYAERGIGALSLDLSQSEGDVESPLEQSVFDTLTGWGYEVVPQVGSSGYRIDLAVRHPHLPGRFLLGVECDGAMYHSSKVARDRDRLRQEVLEGLDWRLHRVWGPSWYRDRGGSERRLRAAVEAALAGSERPPVPERRKPIDRTVTVATPSRPQWTYPYRVTRLENHLFYPHEPEAWTTLLKSVQRVLEREAPIHEDLLARRICWEWGGYNTTKKNREAVAEAVTSLERQGRCQRSGAVVWLGESFDVRVYDGVNEDSRRVIDHIPPEELQEAVYRLLQDAHACSPDELLTEVGRLFGFKRMGAKIQLALDRALEDLEKEGHVTRDARGVLRIAGEELADGD